MQWLGGVRTILLEMRRQQTIAKHQQTRLGLLQMSRPTVASGNRTVRRRAVVHRVFRRWFHQFGLFTSSLPTALYTTTRNDAAPPPTQTHWQLRRPKWRIVVHSWCNFFAVQLVALHAKSNAYERIELKAAKQGYWKLYRPIVAFCVELNVTFLNKPNKREKIQSYYNWVSKSDSNIKHAQAKTLKINTDRHMSTTSNSYARLYSVRLQHWFHVTIGQGKSC